MDKPKPYQHPESEGSQQMRTDSEPSLPEGADVSTDGLAGHVERTLDPEEAERQFQDKVLEKLFEKGENAVVVAGGAPLQIAVELPKRLHEEHPDKHILVLLPTGKATYANWALATGVTRRNDIYNTPHTVEPPDSYYVHPQTPRIHFATSATILQYMKRDYDLGLLRDFDFIVVGNGSDRSLEDEIAIAYLAEAQKEREKRRTRDDVNPHDIKPLKLVFGINTSKSEAALFHDNFQIESDPLEVPANPQTNVSTEYQNISRKIDPVAAISSAVEEMNEEEGDILVLVPTDEMVAQVTETYKDQPHRRSRRIIKVDDLPDIHSWGEGLTSLFKPLEQGVISTNRLLVARPDQLFGCGPMPCVKCVVDLGRIEQRQFKPNGKAQHNIVATSANVTKWAQQLPGKPGSKYIGLFDEGRLKRGAPHDQELARTSAKVIERLTTDDSWRDYRVYKDIPGEDFNYRQCLPLLSEPISYERRAMSLVQADLQRGKPLEKLLEIGREEGCEATAARIAAFELVHQSPYLPGPKDIPPEWTRHDDIELKTAEDLEWRDDRKAHLLRAKKRRWDDYRDALRSGDENVPRNQLELAVAWSKAHPKNTCKGYINPDHPNSDFALQARLLEEFEQMPEDARQSWCKEHHLDFNVFNEVLDILQFLRQRYGIITEDTTDDPNALTRILVKSMQQNFIGWCPTPESRGFTRLDGANPPVMQGRQSLVNTMDPEVTRVYVGGGMPPARGRQEQRAPRLHPVDIGLLLQTIPPQDVVRKVFCTSSLPQTDDDAVFQTAINVRLNGRNINLGTLEDAPISDTERTETFFRALLNFNAYSVFHQIQRELNRESHLYSILESWLQFLDHQEPYENLGDQLNEEEKSKILTGKLEILVELSDEPVYTVERLQHALQKLSLQQALPDNLKITPEDVLHETNGGKKTVAESIPVSGRELVNPNSRLREELRARFPDIDDIFRRNGQNADRQFPRDTAPTVVAAAYQKLLEYYKVDSIETLVQMIQRDGANKVLTLSRSELERSLPGGRR